jgi:hypothetical protein
MSNTFGDRELACLLNDWLETETVRQHFQEAIEQLILTDDSMRESDTNDLSLLYEWLIR